MNQRCREESGDDPAVRKRAEIRLPAPGKDAAYLAAAEHITLCDAGKAMLAGRVMVTEYQESEQYVYVDCGFDDVITVRIDPAEECAVGRRRPGAGAGVPASVR